MRRSSARGSIGSMGRDWMGRLAWAGAASLVPSLAYAHLGVGTAAGMAAGLAHPLTGLDHVAAMVAVGLWAAQCGGRAVWAVPLSFMAAMAAGGALGTLGVALPFVEPGIAASVLVLGLLVAAAVRMPLAASAALVGLFALFHGHAHGTEVAATAPGLAYGVGFVLTTGALHALGIGLGLGAQRFESPRLVRYAGLAAAAFGAYLFVA